MKNMTQHLKILFAGSKLARICQTLITLFRIGCVTVAVVTLLNFGHPDMDVATGGCSVPNGECSTTVIDA